VRFGASSGATKPARGSTSTDTRLWVYKDDVPNVEVGVQVSTSFDPVGRVVPSSLPSGLAATATHTGPIDRIGDTHKVVCEWCKANGHRLTGPRWKIYGHPYPYGRLRRELVLVANRAVDAAPDPILEQDQTRRTVAAERNIVTPPSRLTDA
jgi:hypothetical protein